MTWPHSKKSKTWAIKIMIFDEFPDFLHFYNRNHSVKSKSFKKYSFLHIVTPACLWWNHEKHIFSTKFPCFLMNHRMKTCGSILGFFSEIVKSVISKGFLDKYKNVFDKLWFSHKLKYRIGKRISTFKIMYFCFFPMIY